MKNNFNLILIEYDNNIWVNDFIKPYPIKIERSFLVDGNKVFICNNLIKNFKEDKFKKELETVYERTILKSKI
jgi:hypothetical protein